MSVVHAEEKAKYSSLTLLGPMADGSVKSRGGGVIQLTWDRREWRKGRARIVREHDERARGEREMSRHGVAWPTSSASRRGTNSSKSLKGGRALSRRRRELRGTSGVIQLCWQVGWWWEEK